MSILSNISLTLVIIGALNWGIIGVNNYNFIELLSNKNLIKIIYILIGISAIYLVLNKTILNSISSRETGPLNNPDYFAILDRQGMRGTPVIDDVKIRWNDSSQQLLKAVNADQ